MQPTTILRAEGMAIFAAATAAYFTLDGPLWLFLVLALAPDLSMLSYLAGPRFGSRIYNAFHTYTSPIVLGVVGLAIGLLPLTWVALVWAAHIGADRIVGYGLKYPTGFKHTHLSADSHRRTTGTDGTDSAPDDIVRGAD